MQLITTSALALLGVSFFALEAAANSGFAATCNSILILDPEGNDPHYTLNANCRYAGAGSYNVGTELNLDICFGNSNGHLVAQYNGGFGGSCRNVGNQGSILTAQCGDGHGGWISNSIDMNQYVGNNNGIMYCFDHAGA